MRTRTRQPIETQIAIAVRIAALRKLAAQTSAALRALQAGKLPTQNHLALRATLLDQLMKVARHRD